MQKLVLTNLAIAALLASATCHSADSTEPLNLSGRWVTSDKQYSQLMSIALRGGAAEARITHWSTKSTCSLVDVPASVRQQGESLVLEVTGGLHCATRYKVELVKQPAGSYEAVIETDMSSNSQYHRLTATLSPTL